MDKQQLNRIRDEWAQRYRAKPLPLLPFAFVFLVSLVAVLLTRR